jgi:hypothetical protein
MSRLTRVIVLAALLTLPAVPCSHGADIDRSAVDFTPPSDIKWVKNAAGTAESAVLLATRASRVPTSCASGGSPAT